MDVQRIHREVVSASRQFAMVEAHADSTGGVYVKAAFQTSAGSTYVTRILFDGYPYGMPKVYVTSPTLGHTPHRYADGHLCFLHPTMWNPGRHDLTFVLGRVAKWLNKYEVWRVRGQWPGAEILH